MAVTTVKKEVEMERMGDENNLVKNGSGEVEKSNIVGVVLNQSLDEGSDGGEHDSGLEERKQEVSEEPIVISSEEEEEDGDIYLCFEDPSEDELKDYAFELLNQFFDLNPALLVDLEKTSEGAEEIDAVMDDRQVLKEVGNRVGGRVTKTYMRKCRVCNWAGRSQKELDNHKIIHIQMDRTSRCQQCTAVFFDMRDLKNHEKTKHPENFQCVYCDKKFRTEEYLQKHLDMHTEALSGEGEKPVAQETQERLSPTPVKKKTAKCKECKRSFNNKNSLKRHMRLHK